MRLVNCARCGARYDEGERWTLCPHARRPHFVTETLEALRANLYLQVVVILVLVSVIMQACPARGDTIPAAAGAYRREYTRIVRSEWGLDAPIAALAAQIHAESAWDCRAVSRVGAGGCAQFMPATARWLSEARPGLHQVDVYSPTWAFRAQASYMRWLHDRVKGPAPCERMAFALASYNGGLGYVLRRQKLSTRPLVCLGATCDINPGINPANQRENAAYPRRILRELEPRYVMAGWGESACS